jgi:hypothetical protein
MAERKRDLGDLDAGNDRRFAEHFIESPDLNRILNTESDIVYGTKGVGKTALRRALSEINKSMYFGTTTIDLDQISFAQVHASLSKLHATSQTELSTLARNLWRSVLLMYALECVAARLPSSASLSIDVHEELHREGFAQTTHSNERLLSQIERVFQKLAEAGLESQVSPLGLNSKQRSVIHDFTSRSSIVDLLRKCAVEVRASRKPVLVCLDGFDSIVDHTPESRKAIFAGLIDAVHKLAKDQALADVFCFKVFLPQELADDAQALVWDSDKFLERTHHLQWGKPEFQTLLLRRMRPHSKSKSREFADVWREFMPDSVRNDIHRLDEDSFDYILRHTLYRPRQVLYHVQKIVDRWDERSATFRVDPTFIPPAVAATNYELAEAVVYQLEVKYPGLKGFVQSCSGACNTMTVAQFEERATRMFGLSSSQEVTRTFNNLFSDGLFGFAIRASVSGKSNKNSFRFAFVGDRPGRNVHSSLSPHDIVALAPMFNEYSGCTASEYGVIVPIAV